MSAYADILRLLLDINSEIVELISVSILGIRGLALCQYSKLAF
jgi:hypothetical protein